MYNYILGKKGIKTVVWSIVMLVILSLISCVFDDETSIIFLLSAVCKQKIQQGKLNIGHLNVLLMLTTMQTLLLALAVSMTTLLFNVFGGIHQLADFSKVSHLMIGTEMIIMYLLGFIVLWVVRKGLRQHLLSLRRIQALGIDKHLFIMLLALFGSIEILLMVGNFQGVTATIQSTLLLMFIVLAVMMGWQMLEMIRMYARQKTLEHETLQNKQLNDYLQSVEQQYLELRKFKHDYRNLVVSLSDQNNVSSVKDYLASVTDQAVLDTSLDDAKIAQVQHIQSETIRGIVIQKFLSAQQCGVHLNIEMPDANFVIKADSAVDARIIGILLDQAIRQAQSASDKTVTIAFNEISETMEISINYAIKAESEQDSHEAELTKVRELIAYQQGFYLDVENNGSYDTITLIITEEQ
ncbi:hypothetical protein [Lactiplantibacillus herbarum]|uniref:hypothetical protein n=1 Tax=Lactiplantibacillus herbarum TaxID=1670446 RepID=UPI00069CFE72|nr:hypothetical protein [Lactiplantibacillus herbarum]